MKRRLMLILLAVASVTAFADSFKKGAKAYVSVKSAELKASAGTAAKTQGTAAYGDCVIVLEPGSKKTRVALEKNQSVTGWIANGSLTKKKIVASGNSSVRASTDELALAGKGFSEEAENAYKASNGALDFALVDKIEALTVSAADLAAFKQDGNLHPPEDE